MMKRRVELTRYNNTSVLFQILKHRLSLYTYTGEQDFSTLKIWRVVEKNISQLRVQILVFGSVDPRQDCRSLPSSAEPELGRHWAEVPTRRRWTMRWRRRRRLRRRWRQQGPAGGEEKAAHCWCQRAPPQLLLSAFASAHQTSLWKYICK